MGVHVFETERQQQNVYIQWKLDSVERDSHEKQDKLLPFFTSASQLMILCVYVCMCLYVWLNAVNKTKQF